MTLDALTAAPAGSRLVPRVAGRITYLKLPSGMWIGAGHGGYSELRADQLGHIIHLYRLVEGGSPSVRVPR